MTNAKDRKIILCILIAVFCISLIFGQEIVSVINYMQSGQVLSYYGSRGDEVIRIQTRLKQWGYYTGAVDGIYGYKTYQAVRLFQSKNGLKVDGVCGPQTLAAIGLPTGVTQTASASTRSNDERLLAHLVYGESRGEPYTGQVAVAAVVLNRVEDSRFPKTISGVIYQPGAFTAVSDGQINLAPNDTAFKAARDALNGWDPSRSAIYYFNPATATSKWIWSRPIVAKIGKHYFCK